MTKTTHDPIDDTEPVETTRPDTDTIQDDVQPEQTATMSDAAPSNFFLSSEKFSKVLGNATVYTTQIAKKTEAVIKGDYSIVLSPYAAYVIRVLAVLTLVLAFVNPVFNLGGDGIFAWIQTFVLNVVVVFGLFVVAEVVLIQRDIATALQVIAAQQQMDNEDDG